MKQFINRKTAIQEIKQEYPDALYVSSVGLISRELYHIGDSKNHFYMMGSMGSALGFAIGIALNIKTDVVVLVGDGEMLMSLGTLALLNELRNTDTLLGNIYLYILDNNQYEATGGQPTCSNSIDFESISNCNIITYCRSKRPPRIPLEHTEIFKRFSCECQSRGSTIE